MFERLEVEMEKWLAMGEREKKRWMNGWWGEPKKVAWEKKVVEVSKKGWVRGLRVWDPKEDGFVSVGDGDVGLWKDQMVGWTRAEEMEGRRD